MSDVSRKSTPWLDIGLLARNRDFRNVFIARTISLLGLGMLSVAIPLQVFELSGDSARVGLALALEGGGMFAGLLLGGMLADRYDRKCLILLARMAAGLGFVALAINAFWAHGRPEQKVLWAIYLLALWDGFFGAIGVTALLAAMPHIVGRENLLQARALSMLSMRLAMVVSPAVGGLLIALWGVSWNYLIAALATGLTLLPLLGLPRMRPELPDKSHPLRSLAEGLRFLLGNKVLAGVVLVGVLLTFATAIRALFPALVQTTYAGGAFELGLMYSAVPLGASVAALLSGWASQLARPGMAMQFIGLGAFVCLLALGLSAHFFLALVLLTLFGGLVAVAALLQYALVQGHTPDAYLGRVNGLWTAQDALGDSVGTLGAGWLAQALSPLGSLLVLGGASLILGVGALAGLPALRNAPLEAVSPVAVSRATS